MSDEQGRPNERLGKQPKKLEPPHEGEEALLLLSLATCFDILPPDYIVWFVIALFKLDTRLRVLPLHDSLHFCMTITCLH